ncbi:hypothetical protein [Lentibacillus sp. Marseille-P4043]|uniref:hypothetical protein n=1 Tax=Lentibacillus sp. Marseille-P4043 TaxID=2040293 RepID=UPI00131A4E61|nr:hypothetical protein [Lentibacillus sp. Marseille-P4043]
MLLFNFVADIRCDTVKILICNVFSETSAPERKHRPECEEHRRQSENIVPNAGNIGARAKTSSRMRETSAPERKHRPECEEHRRQSENIVPNAGNIGARAKTSSRMRGTSAPGRKHRPECEEHRRQEENIVPEHCPHSRLMEKSRTNLRLR